MLVRDVGRDCCQTGPAQLALGDPPDLRPTGLSLKARPKRYPPRDFPPRKPGLLLEPRPRSFRRSWGCWLAGAVTLALDRLGWDRGAGNMVAGLGVALCGLTAFAHTAKLMWGALYLSFDRTCHGQAGDRRGLAMAWRQDGYSNTDDLPGSFVVGLEALAGRQACGADQCRRCRAAALRQSCGPGRPEFSKTPDRSL